MNRHTPRSPSGKAHPYWLAARHRAALALLLLLGSLGQVSLASAADNLDRLRRFLDGTQTLRAQFTQTQVGRGGKPTAPTSGQLAIARPGKFRWQIEQPYPQLIVGDGSKVWIYDPELKQVTRKKMTQTLGNTPAALLTGNSASLDQHFKLRDAGEKEGLAWIEALPKSSADATFERVLLGFAGDTLKTMTLVDSFGQTTVVIFSKSESNVSLPANLFHFTPPAGVDVVGE